MVEKILFQHEIFGHDRFLLQLTVGSVDHAQTMRAIELYGTGGRARSTRGSGPPIQPRRRRF